MSLFDQLRPKWRHSDPAVRLEAVGRLDDQSALESIAEHDPDDKVRVAAIQALTNQSVIARLAVSAESALVRECAVGRTEDRALLLRMASSDPNAVVRAHARARCAGATSAGCHLREILSKLQVAERSAERVAEFCGTLDEVCSSLSHDPRFFINGDVTSDEEDSGAARLRDTTQAPWVTPVLHSNLMVARFVAQPRQPTGNGSSDFGPTRFFHVKVWCTADNRFDLQAEEKQFCAINDASAWSRASGGGPETYPAVVGGDPSA